MAKNKKVTVQEPASIEQKLINIQCELKAPKGQFNAFGKYKYRSCEDILEALKPVLLKHNAVVVLSDELVRMVNRFYIKATATLVDIDSDKSIDVTAFAREEESKKGMDGSQITGASSSYARKYALNGLFGIDDSTDSDKTNGKTTTASKAVTKTAKPAAKVESLLTDADMKSIAKFLQEINNVKGKKELDVIGSRLKAGIAVKKFNPNQIKVLKASYTSKLKQFAAK